MATQMLKRPGAGAVMIVIYKIRKCFRHHKISFPLGILTHAYHNTFLPVRKGADCLNLRAVYQQFPQIRSTAYEKYWDFQQNSPVFPKI
jgi:hypothetical protein